MGYDATVRDIDIKLRLDVLEEAMRLLKERHENRSGNYEDYGPFGTRSASDPVPADTFPDALGEIGWYGERDDALGEYRVYRDGTKYRETEEVFWAAVAPVVVPGSYIEFHGEDGALWKWEFRDGDVRTFEGHIAWVANGEA